MRPKTQYAKTPDGLIAYQVMGEGPFDVIYLSGSTSNVDVRWEAPEMVHQHERLSSFSRLIVFDRLGTGTSDPIRIDAPPTWEEWANELEVVMDAVGSQRAVLFAVLDAGPMAMIFAATHPDRTLALVLGNSAARLLVADDYPIGISGETADAVVRTVEESWGTEEFATMYAPALSSDPRLRAWFAKYMRASATPRAAAAQIRMMMDLDVRSVLPAIRVPTLVFHRREFPAGGIEVGRYVADHIDGAKFIELPGSDTAWVSAADIVLDAVEEFLTGVRPAADSDRVLATILFTDLVDSTRRAEELGDRKWRELLDRHDELARRAIELHRGRMIRTMGDGLLATFDAPGRAIRCTLDLNDAVTGLGIAMRAGIHAGEVELRGDDVGGIAVAVAARVSALAGGGEVLVSRTVRDLVAGSGVQFTDRGVHALKGVSDDWQLFAVAS